MFKNILLILSIVLISFSAFAGQGETYAVKVKVDGLACPFCAYGLEKKLKDYEGISDLKILVDEGYAVFRLPYGKTPHLAELKERVKKGGFTAKDITINVSGTFKSVNGEKLLTMDGLGKSFLLTGRLKGYKDGLKVVVKGKLLEIKQKRHAQHPLTVEVSSWRSEK